MFRLSTASSTSTLDGSCSIPIGISTALLEPYHVESVASAFSTYAYQSPLPCPPAPIPAIITTPNVNNDTSTSVRRSRTSTYPPPTRLSLIHPALRPTLPTLHDLPSPPNTGNPSSSRSWTRPSRFEESFDPNASTTCLTNPSSPAPTTPRTGFLRRSNPPVAPAKKSTGKWIDGFGLSRWICIGRYHQTERSRGRPGRKLVKREARARWQERENWKEMGVFLQEAGTTGGWI